MIRMTTEPIDVEAARRHVDNPSHGGAVVFEGVVRDHARARDVRRLEYEAYPEMAERVFARIAEEIEKRWGPLDCAIWHRYGPIEIGEVAVVVAVSSAHRAEAFEACR
ncbi:MAG: molybdenum cofactor biosynthesis protein MoaE, partial [Myxococcales bacterium]|nr:molybdenum cofactor biosynthesis protein MoaE [Myxococcales bacterium]